MSWFIVYDRNLRDFVDEKVMKISECEIFEGK